MTSIQDFLDRADRYAASHKLARTTVSKKLFGNTRKLDELASGSASVTHRVLTAADEVLTALEKGEG